MINLSIIHTIITSHIWFYNVLKKEYLKKSNQDWNNQELNNDLQVVDDDRVQRQQSLVAQDRHVPLGRASDHYRGSACFILRNNIHTNLIVMSSDAYNIKDHEQLWTISYHP